MPTSIGQPNPIFLMLVCLLSLVGSAAIQAQDKPAQPAEKLTLQQVLSLNEIAALQARLGGGVTEQLKGVVPGASPEQQFLESLRSLVQQQESTEPQLVPPKKSRVPLAIRKTSVAAEVSATAAPWRVQSKASPANGVSPQQVLRSSARALEELAAELEQAQLYDKADELRKMAAQYWMQARSME